MEYTILTWPKSQYLYQQNWFDECELINDEEGIETYGPSAYKVPTKYLTFDKSK